MSDETTARAIGLVEAWEWILEKVGRSGLTAAEALEHARTSESSEEWETILRYATGSLGKEPTAMRLGGMLRQACGRPRDVGGRRIALGYSTAGDGGPFSYFVFVVRPGEHFPPEPVRNTTMRETLHRIDGTDSARLATLLRSAAAGLRSSEPEDEVLFGALMDAASDVDGAGARGNTVVLELRLTEPHWWR